jgi:hypothetical protein
MLAVYWSFPRLFRRNVAQRTDDRFRLVFSRSRPKSAFPTPLRQVIGHRWPWHRLPGPMAFRGMKVTIYYLAQQIERIAGDPGFLLLGSP